jgi:aldose 1-epimerase
VRRPPSGEQIDLHHREHHAVIVEVGGGLRAYTLGERRIIDGYGPERICDGSRGQVLVPWPNRLRDGRYEWEGAELQLDISDVKLHNAIHGLAAWRNWTVTGRSDASVVMRQVLHPTHGYPFELELEVSYELGEDGLTVTITALNASERACPYGAGFHPYLAPPGLELIDGCEVRLPAASYQLADERMLPYANASVTKTPYDFRSARALGDVALDHCFLDLEHDGEGIARASISGPAGTTTVWADSTHRYLQLYSGDTLAAPERRRGLAIEPMTCAPNAFVSGDGLVRLEPGERHISRCGITPS